MLVHGFTDNALYYSRLAEVLASQWDVVAYDCRGHGKSDRANGAFSSQDRADDLVGVIQTLGLDRPALIGHSMGGATITTALAQHPGLSRGAVLEDPAWWEPSQPADEAEAARQAEARVQRNTDWCESIRTLQAGTWEEALTWRRSDSPLWSDEDVELSAASRFEVELDLFNYFPTVRSDFRELVGRIDCPSLLVCGDPSRGAIITEEQAADVRELNPLFQSVRIDAAGHAVRYDQFDAFCAAVTPFLSSLM